MKKFQPQSLPENNALGLKPQTTPALSDGYWVILRPLPTGGHTIHANGSLVDFTTTGTVNFAIIPIAKPIAVLPVKGIPRSNYKRSLQ